MAGTDSTAGKVAFASVVFAGFAYVGYSAVKNVFSRNRSRKRLNNAAERGEKPMYFRRFSTSSTASQTDVGTDVVIANVESRTTVGQVIMRPTSVQEKIREMNLRAVQFGEGLMALHANSRISIPGIRRAWGKTPAGSIASRSLQASPWNTPRALSPVDNRHRAPAYQSVENLSSSFLNARVWGMPRRGTLQGRPNSNGDQVSENDSDVESQPTTETDEPDAMPDFSTTGNGILTPGEAKALTVMLRNRDTALVQRSLVTISNCAAYTVNQDLLREAGCLSQLHQLLMHRNGTVRVRATQCLGNLSLNEENMKEMRDVIPLLWSQLPAPGRDENHDSELTVSTLLSLTNMAVLPTWHMEFIPGLGTVYKYVDRSARTFQLQALKLLTNLYCNEDMIPSLLGAEGCQRLVPMLDNSTDSDVLLRLITFVANLCSAVKRLRVTPADIPPMDKVASPETMYARIYGVAVFDRLQDKVRVVSRFNACEEIRFHANRIIDAFREEGEK